MSLDAQKLTDLLTALASFNAAIRGRLDNKLDINAVAFDSNKLGGKTLAEVQALIGDAAVADLTALNAEFEAFIARQDNPHNVTKAQVGLGNVDNFGTATNVEAVAGVLTNKFLTPANLQAFWANKVGSAPETLDTIQELAAALQNNPDALTALQQLAGNNQAAITQLQTDLAAAIAGAAADATAKADAAQAAAIAAAATDATAKADAAEADANAYTDGREVAIRTDMDSGLASKLGKLEQAADSAKLGGLSLEEVIAQITNGSGVELAIKIDITEGYAPGSSITLDRVFFYDAVGDEIEHLVDLSGIQVVGGYVNYINGKVELSDLNSQSSVVFTGFGEVPKEVTHVNLEFTNLYDAKGTLSVVNAADASEVFGTYAFDAAGAQLVRDPWADGFDFPFTMPSAGGLSLAALQAAIAELESRAVLDGEHVSTNLVTFDHLDLVLEKQIQDFDTELLTREVGQELWSVVRNAGVDTFSMSTDGVSFNPLPPLEMFPEAQRPVYEALFTELSVRVNDEEVTDGTVFYAVTEDRTVLSPVSKVDVLLKDVLSVLETKVAQLFKDVSRNHQNSMASDNQIRDDLGNLRGEVYDLNRGVVETLAGAPEMAVKFDFSAAWTQGALHQIEALEFLGGDDSVIGTVALDQVKLHSGIMGYENGVINLSGLRYLQPRQTVLNIGDIPTGAVKLRVVGTGLENGVGVLEVGSIGAKGVVYGSLAIVENLDVANSLVVPFAVPKLSDINVLKDQAADVADRVADLETDKLDATAQAVDSAKLEGKTKAEIIAEAQAGVDLSQVVLKSDDFGQYSVGGQTLTALVAALNAADSTNAGSIAAVQTALNDFIAAKATSAEAIAGTDDAKYITALGLKAAVDAAINGVVDGAPAALNTLKELADALANQEDAVAALVTVIDTKLNQAQVQAEIASVVNPIDVRLTAVEDAIGTGSDFLQKGISDLGTNPVYLASDVPTVTGGDNMVASYFEPGVQLRASKVGGVYTIEYNEANDGVDWVVVDESTLAGAQAYVDALYISESLPDTTVYYFSVNIEEPETATLATLIDGLKYSVQALEGQIQDKLDRDDAIGTNTVTFPDAESLEPTQQALDDVLERLRLAVEDVKGGSASDLADLQTAFNNFVAAKATTAEVIAGTDDAKYTTSLSVKGAIDAAIADLVGSAPEALNTINELAAALNNDPNIIGNLMTQIGTKLDATAQAVDSAKLQGRTIADLTASNQDVIDGTSTDKFVTPAALSIKQNAQDAAIAANTAAISDLMTQMAAAFDAAAADLDSATP